MSSTIATELSAQEFIRSLKAPSDPPRAGAPTKIDIARNAWERPSFNVPNKDEAIVEFILTTLLKARAKEQESNPILDLRYWQLLDDVLTVRSRTSDPTGRARPLKTWLGPVLNRIPIAPIAISFLSLSASHLSAISSQSLASRSLCALWPSAVSKFTAETLLECFGAVLGLLAAMQNLRIGDSDVNVAAHLQEIAQLMMLVVSSYKSSLANTASKKKLHSNFIQYHLPVWIECIRLEAQVAEPFQTLYVGIYETGIETLFNLDTLRYVQDQGSESALEEALCKTMATHPASGLASLPRLFTSFVQTTRRYRGALFGQGSSNKASASAEQARAAAMQFFAMCDSLLEKSPERAKMWNTRVALLSIVDLEGLFDAKDELSIAILRRCGELAIDALVNAARDQMEHNDSALSILSTLTHIDYDLIPSALGRVFPKLTMMSGSVDSALVYLKHLLEYHTKTRTMDTYILLTLRAFGNLPTQSLSCGPRIAYDIASSSPSSHHTYLAGLAKSIQSFLTPGQVLDTAQSTLEELEKAVLAFQQRESQADADEGIGPRKMRKRHEESSPGTPASDADVFAVAFSLVAREASVVLTSLPLHSLLEGDRRQIHDSIRTHHHTMMRPILKHAFKKIRKDDRNDTWAWQIVAIAALRLQHSLTSATQVESSLEHDVKAFDRMLPALSSELVIPELRVEILRTLLNDASLLRCEPEIVFDHTLRLLDSVDQQQGCGWSGELHRLTADADRHQAEVAILHLLVDRWLSMFDACATPAQLQRLVKIFMRADLSGSLGVAGVEHQGTLTMPMVVRRALYNAEFWEMPRLRDAFLSYINEETAELDSVDLAKCFHRLKAGKVPKLAMDIHRAIASYNILLLTPPEYLTRTVRTNLLRRALSGDVALSSAPGNQKPQVHPLRVLREFVWRTFSHMGVVEHQNIAQYLTYVMDAPSLLTNNDMALVSVTLDLVRMHMSALLKIVTKGHEADFADLLRHFIECPELNAPSEKSATSSSLRVQSLVLLINILTGDYRRADFQGTALSLLIELQQRLLSGLVPTMTSFASPHPSSPDLASRKNLLELWCSLLLLRRWLDISDTNVPLLGRALVSKVLSSPVKGHVSEDILVAVLSIVLEELHISAEGDHAECLHCIVATYIAFRRFGSNTAWTSLDARISKACKMLSFSDYSSVLNLLADDLASGSLVIEDLVSLINLSSIMVHNAPEGSSKATQSHITRCLNLFADRPIFATKRSLRLHILTFLARFFNDRPASIRPQDISSLWSFLGSCLAGSPEHEPTTERGVFHEIVSLISALVRLRRDLVLSTLPHLGIMLRRLIITLKAPRPHLGAKQNRMVADTLPAWICPSNPLGPEESRALARLLTTLITKTTVRTYGSITEAQKAESLARPFSKHAASVLTAYIASLNDSLCVLSADVRRELEPGLFALCDMLGEHDRDSMMVSALDAGGKTVMKTLWREYEKQRYIGKG